MNLKKSGEGYVRGFEERKGIGRTPTHFQLCLEWHVALICPLSTAPLV